MFSIVFKENKHVTMNSTRESLKALCSSFFFKGVVLPKNVKWITSNLRIVQIVVV
jgi:hypothetical protein